MLLLKSEAVQARKGTHNTMHSALPRVVQVFTSLNLGGMERQTLQLVRLLAESGQYEVHVASLRSNGPLKEDLEGLGFRNFPSYPLQSLHDLNAGRQVLRFAGFLRSLRACILHTHDFYTNTFGILAGALAGIPIRIASRRELDVFTPWQRRFDHLAYRGSHCVVANCEFLRKRLTEEGVPPEKSTVIANGIELERFSKDGHDGPELRASFGLPRSGRVVTMVANLHNERKDHLTFAVAASRLTQDLPEVVFVIAGDGQGSAALREAMAPLRANQRLFLLGSCQRIPELLATSDVGVLCSHSEGMPNAVLEYMAAGLPVVASDVGGANEAVLEGETGYLVPPGDAAAVAERVSRLLQREDLGRRMGEAGRQRVQRHFSLATQQARVLETYTRLLEKRYSSRHQRSFVR